jgi:1,2-diacylglycerol 3-alpha-glucosyltransferase
MARNYSRMFCNSATAVTTPSEKTRTALLKYGVHKPIHFIPTGIDFSKFNKEQFSENDLQSARAGLGLNPADPVIITIGRVAKEKGMEYIIKAMPLILKNNPAVKYVSVGDGPCIDDFKALAKQLGVEKNIFFAGPRPWAEIGKYYRAGDLFVSGSTSETQGISYIEAMASETPVVAKKDPCLEGILHHGETGMFFDTVEELAESVCVLLAAPQERKRLAQNAYNNIQPLSDDVFVKKIEELYEKTLEEHKNRKRRTWRTFTTKTPGLLRRFR